jgi:hypothetical protein
VQRGPDARLRFIVAHSEYAALCLDPGQAYHRATNALASVALRK